MPPMLDSIDGPVVATLHRAAVYLSGSDRAVERTTSGGRDARDPIRSNGEQPIPENFHFGLQVQIPTQVSMHFSLAGVGGMQMRGPCMQMRLPQISALPSAFYLKFQK